MTYVVNNINKIRSNVCNYIKHIIILINKITFKSNLIQFPHILLLIHLIYLLLYSKNNMRQFKVPEELSCYTGLVSG
jgi:hypothetical protein